MRKQKILITGACGQIGSVLTTALQEKYGFENVLATDISIPKNKSFLFEKLDITLGEKLNTLVKSNNITQIYHLAAILSAKGEQNPLFTWNINMTGLFNVLEAARKNNIEKVFFPSSIGAFGPKTPKFNTPQDTILIPETVYGITKVSGELWANYYFKKYGLDIRSVRFPGIIGYQSLPGGGTTDYAVEIFHEALKEKVYECFLKKDTRLPMLYMPDAIKAILQLMDAPKEKITIRTSYNLSEISFTPGELAEEIKKYIPDFKISYKPDFRQEIADSWTDTIDDSKARIDWNWNPDFNLKSMTKDMIEHLETKYLAKI